MTVTASPKQQDGVIHASPRLDRKPAFEIVIDSGDLDLEDDDATKSLKGGEDQSYKEKRVVVGGHGEEEQGEDGDDEPKVPDGGYGWFVVLGCFISHVITGGFERSDGVFFLQFLARFDKSAQLTAWPGALVSTLRLFLGPLSSAISNRYSVRSTALVGGLLIAVGFIMTSVAPNFYFLFFSHVLVHGLGRGLAYAPALIIVGMYFDKRRGVAAGLGSSGVGIGTFLVVPLSQFLFDTYGFQGAFFILGGFSLNMLAVAMLFRPLSMHYRFTRARNAQKMRRVDTNEGFVLSQATGAWDDQSVRSWRSHSVSSSYQLSPEASAVVKRSKERDHVIEKSQNDVVKNNKPKGCFKSAMEIILPIEFKDKSKQKKKSLFNFVLLKNAPFLLYCLSIWMFTLAFKAGFTFLPALVKSRGISESKAALVLSIAGIIDTFGRIAAGLLLDLPSVRPFRVVLYNSFQFLVAGIAFIMPSLHSFWSFVLISSLYAMLTGAYVSQKSVINVDILGVEHMASSFGLLICFQGLGTLIGPPLSGALKDHFGSYDEAFYLGGCCMVLAAFLMLGSNITLHLQKKRLAKEAAAANNTTHTGC